MKKNMIQSFKLSTFVFAIIASFLMMACSSDHENIVTENESKEGVEFKLEFLDYAEREEVGTRAVTHHSVDTLQHDTTSLGDGLMAEVTMVSDTAIFKPMSPAKTRALANDSYTIYAYQGNTLKNILTGNVSGGVFHPTSVNKKITLSPGVYTFICANSGVSFDGTTTLKVGVSDAGRAMIGKADNVTITPTPRDQTVTFQMKHIGSLLSVQLVANTPIPAGISGTIYTHAASPTVAFYTMPSNVYNYVSGNFNTDTFNFQPSSESAGSIGYSSWSNGWRTFLPGTQGNSLLFGFTGGSLYNQNLAGKQLFLNPNPAISMQANKTYGVIIRLHPQFLYLMNDGSVALTRNVPAKQAAGLQPIGLVLSQSQRIAIALNDVPMGANNIFIRRFDLISNISATNNTYDWYSNDSNGWNYTWDPNYVKDRPTGTTTNYCRADMDNYAGWRPVLDGSCWRAAGYFNPGPPLIGSLAGGRKSYLGGIWEWKHLIPAMYAGSAVGAPGGANLNMELVQRAFTQFGGTVPSGHYYTSTEIDHSATNCSWDVSMNTIGTSYYLDLHVLAGSNISGAKVRPFFKY